jgi:aryl-alcohol dehydrogenase-like predicted oxidoreductase
VRTGKVLYIGCSNFYAWQVMEGLAASRAHQLSEFAAVQPLYNVVNRDAELELLPLCEKYALGVVVYSPLARGVLSGKYRAGEALPEGSRAARGDRRINQTELRPESFAVADALRPLASAHGKSPAQFALAWALANRLVTSVIVGPRTEEQLADNLGAIDFSLTPEDEARVDSLVPRGEHTGKGYNDPQYPVRGRVTA